MGKFKNNDYQKNGLFIRITSYLLTSIVIPFVIRIIKRKIEENNRIICNNCQGKLKEINKGEYYCKNCKIIRMDKK
jgi:tRNA(Ile2) C34 agmatinyltransferase TiaS